jgi:peptidyl-prolyl cis-trans isomerase B (cyclophilin B)
MARNSAGSQFYLTLADTPFLDNDYAVFGEVTNGMDVLDQLNEMGTGSGTPTQKVIIESVTVELNGVDVPNVKKV